MSWEPRYSQTNPTEEDIEFLNRTTVPVNSTITTETMDYISIQDDLKSIQEIEYMKYNQYQNIRSTSNDVNMAEIFTDPNSFDENLLTNTNFETQNYTYNSTNNAYDFRNNDENDVQNMAEYDEELIPSFVKTIINENERNLQNTFWPLSHPFKEASTSTQLSNNYIFQEDNIQNNNLNSDIVIAYKQNNRNDLIISTAEKTFNCAMIDNQNLEGNSTYKEIGKISEEFFKFPNSQITNASIVDIPQNSVEEENLICDKNDANRQDGDENDTNRHNNGDENDANRHNNGDENDANRHDGDENDANRHDGDENYANIHDGDENDANIHDGDENDANRHDGDENDTKTLLNRIEKFKLDFAKELIEYATIKYQGNVQNENPIAAKNKGKKDLKSFNYELTANEKLEKEEEINSISQYYIEQLKDDNIIDSDEETYELKPFFINLDDFNTNCMYEKN